MKLFIITGQTATGKTNYALQLAKKYDGELINSDSRQIYNGLDIITGKDRSMDTKIWLYDIIDPKKYFSSYDFVDSALQVLKNILSRGKTPIIVGGTYFYLYHLLYDVKTEHIPPDWELRNRLNQKSVVELQKIFKSFDLPAGRHGRLNNSDRNNPQRLIRKIEILTHNKNSAIDSFEIPRSISLSKKLNDPIQVEYVGLRYKSISKLTDIIKKRVEKRIAKGAIEEVKKLLKQGYSGNDPGLKTIGYTQIIAYIKGELTLKEAIEQWISKETQYAKRQYTFMKKDPNLSWKDID